MAVPWRERPPFLTGGAFAPATRGGRSRHAVTAGAGLIDSRQRRDQTPANLHETRAPAPRIPDRDVSRNARQMPARSTRPVCGPSSPIVRLASARSRRFALLRPRCARLAALTAPSANLERQLSTAQVNGDHIKSAHRFTNLLTKRIGSAIFKSFLAGCSSQPPPHRPVWSTRNRRPQVTVLSLLSTHSLVAHSRDHTSADHAIVSGLRCGPRLQRRVRSLDARACTRTSGAHVPDPQS